MSGRTPRRSASRRHHFLYAYWKAVMTLLTGYLIVFAYSFHARGSVIERTIESLRHILVQDAATYVESRVQWILGFDITGHLVRQFTDLLASHGGLPLLAFLVVGGLLAVAFEWRFGTLLE